MKYSNNTTISLSALEELARAFSTKRPWSVRKSEKPGAHKPSELLRNLLLLRHFELSVASNIIECQIPSSLKDFYEVFVEDEYRHDKQLEELALHCGCNNDELPQEVIIRYESIKKATHPLLLNFLLEQLFLVSLPLIQKQGDVFCNYVSAWILSDEAVHVRFGRIIIRELGLTVEEDHISFLMWMLEFLGLPERSKKVLLHNLLKGTASEEFLGEQVILSPRISFFEQANVSYGSEAN